MPELKSKSENLKTAVASALEPLWVSGLALLCVLVGNILLSNVLHVEGELYEWAIYLVLGTIFPGLLLIFALTKRGLHTETTLGQISRLFLSALLLVVAAVFVVGQHQYTAFALSMAHVGLMLISLKLAGFEIKPASILVACLTVVIAWTISARLLWWSSFGAWFFDTDSKTEVVFRFLVCLFALLLVYVNLNGKPESETKTRYRFGSIANMAAIVLIAIASVRSDQLFNAMSYSHWGVVVGPAEMVRQGGWLFWDVPSQYGFLNILLVAVLPFKSAWQSTYIVNSFLLFASAVFLFFLLRSVRTGLTNFVFALAVTLAAVFLIAGWPPALLGPQVFPSLGPFRFICCYALVLILIWEFRANSDSWRIPLTGCFIWLIGTLWSSESAVYCAAIWLPAYALIIVRKVGSLPADGSGPSRVRTIIFRGMIPPVLLALSVGLITVWYLVGLGHAPDWLGFYEYSLAFTGGFLTIPMDVNGPVWVIFLIFCALSTVAAYFLRYGLKHKAMALIAGTWGALWATSSYFVSRSHPNNATVLAPMLCISIGVVLYLLSVSRITDWWARLVKMSFVPVLTILITITFGNASFLGLYLSSPKIGYENNINSHLPVLDPSLLDLLNTTGITNKDPIIYSAVRVRAAEPAADGLKHDGGVMVPAWPISSQEFFASYRTWLPTMPFVLFDPLPTTRKQVYMERFSARRHLSGWLIQNKKEAPYTASPWFYDQITKTHTPTKMFENNDWQVIWFESRLAKDK